MLVGVSCSCWGGLEREGWTSAKDMRSGVGRVVVVSIQLSEVLIKTAVGTEIEGLSAYAVVGEITEGPDKDGVGDGDDSDPNAPIEAATNQQKLASHIVDLRSKALEVIEFFVREDMTVKYKIIH